jgi:hypothetical protein
MKISSIFCLVFEDDSRNGHDSSSAKLFPAE